MEIKDIKEKMRLTTSDDQSRIFVVPIDKFNYITFPIEDLSKAVAISLDDFIKLRFGIVCFSDDLKSLIETEQGET